MSRTASPALTAASQVLAPYLAQPAIHRQWTASLLAELAGQGRNPQPGAVFPASVSTRTLRVLPIFSTHLSTGW